MECKTIYTRKQGSYTFSGQKFKDFQGLSTTLFSKFKDFSKREEENACGA